MFGVVSFLLNWFEFISFSLRNYLDNPRLRLLQNFLLSFGKPELEITFASLAA